LRRDIFGEVTGDVAGENVWKRLIIEPNIGTGAAHENPRSRSADK